jgi:[acyl-carrier-protein] S-malonyltransferase
MSVELKVSAPFHCPLMQPARDAMEPVLQRLDVAPLRFDVISNVTAAPYGGPSDVAPLLLEQITSPVRWHESMAAVVKLGVDAAIEFGCGRVLAGLMRRIDRKVKVAPVEDLASLKSAAELLGPARP